MPDYVKTGLYILGLLLVLGAGAYVYFLYSPVPKEPALSTVIRPDAIRVGDRDRAYLAYVPANLPAGKPLLIVLHGSGIDGATIRKWTGYEFDQAADKHGFVLLYPDGYKNTWNDCRRVAPYPAKLENIDDMGFIRALIGRMKKDHQINARRVFVVGYSNGAVLAYRIANEAPQLVSAIAAISASLPDPANSICTQTGRTPRVMLVAGTADPISPFDGGEVSLFGLKKFGRSLSARATADHFAQRNGLIMKPVTTQLPHRHPDDPTSVSRLVWSENGVPMVDFYAVQGGGHVVPQPAYRFARLFGLTTQDLDAPAVALAFFGVTSR